MAPSAVVIYKVAEAVKRGYDLYAGMVVVVENHLEWRGVARRPLKAKEGWPWEPAAQRKQFNPEPKAVILCCTDTAQFGELLHPDLYDLLSEAYLAFEEEAEKHIATKLKAELVAKINDCKDPAELRKLLSQLDS